MINLEQIRAAAALKVKDANKVTKADVNKLPALIISNGLLAATAFAVEDGKSTRAGMKSVMDHASQHLKNPVLGLDSLAGVTNAQGLIRALTESGGSSNVLQRATAEVLAFLGYVKRFVPAEIKADNRTQAD